MVSKTHCDLCDKVIPNKIVIRTPGNCYNLKITFCNEEKDVCVDCIKKNVKEDIY